MTTKFPHFVNVKAVGRLGNDLTQQQQQQQQMTNTNTNNTTTIITL